MFTAHPNIPVSSRGTQFVMTDNTHLDLSHFVVGIVAPNLFTFNLVSTQNDTYPYSYKRQAGFDWNDPAKIKHADLWKFQILKRAKLVVNPRRRIRAPTPNAFASNMAGGVSGVGSAGPHVSSSNHGNTMSNNPTNKSTPPSAVRSAVTKKLKVRGLKQHDEIEESGSKSGEDSGYLHDNEDEEMGQVPASVFGVTNPFFRNQSFAKTNQVDMHKHSTASEANPRKRLRVSSHETMSSNIAFNMAFNMSSNIDPNLDPNLGFMGAPSASGNQAHEPRQVKKTKSEHHGTSQLGNSIDDHESEFLAGLSRMEEGFNQWIANVPQTGSQFLSNYPDNPDNPDQEYWDQFQAKSED